MPVMEQIADGIHHWSAEHPRIKQLVHSAYVPDAGLVIDPIAAPGLAEEIRSLNGAGVVALTNRHHLRDAMELAEELDAEIRAPAPGMHEFDDDAPVSAYEWGDEIAPGVTAHAVGAICPDDGALHIAHGPGALAMADGIIRWEDELAFVPDFLMDEPEQVKAAQLEATHKLLALDFETLLLAHGEPVARGAKQALESFLARPASADFG